MTEDAVVARLCNLPVDFKRMKLSSVSLVERSGYLEFPKALSPNRVELYLRDNPALVDAWQIWSEDQRTSPAWAFEHKGAEYCVHLAPGGERLSFTDRYKACAEFVVRQILSIARHAKKRPV
ncbi:MAG: hypothetical protein JO261_07110 [Alphaproteobacteria bacterium]|nr:hypothetical protein [Alphaproteobacteria bacterium]MBV9693451.1 hypothetical protein [Alphaproteobacteria bacterium]